jgi:mitogen-activated protein kinase kinase
MVTFGPLLFLLFSLQKDQEKRPSYAELLEHPFIKKYENVDVDMAKWATEAVEDIKK